MAATVLDVRGLRLPFISRDGPAPVPHGIDLHIRAGETLALVWESGSGKPAASLAVMGRHDRRRTALTGEVRLRARGCDQDLLGPSPRARRRAWGTLAVMVFEEPMTSLDPAGGHADGRGPRAASLRRATLHAGAAPQPARTGEQRARSAPASRHSWHAG